MVEYYAGVGRIARLASCAGYRAAAYDVVYDRPEVTDTWPGSDASRKRWRSLQSGTQRAMDLTSPAGFSYRVRARSNLN